MTNKTSSKLKKVTSTYLTNNRFNQDDSEDDYQNNENFLSFCAKSYTINDLSVPIDGDFREPAYYRHVVQAISNLEEGDKVEFIMNSRGGRLDGLVAILGALDRTLATSCAIISGKCHSAASILALKCDSIAVSNYAEMLCHYVTYGSVGPAVHVKKEVEHIEKTSEKLFRSAYKYFLTEEEITNCIENDLQIWLDATQITERLQRRQELQQKEIEDHQKESDEEEC